MGTPKVKVLEKYPMNALILATAILNKGTPEHVQGL